MTETASPTRLSPLQKLTAVGVVAVLIAAGISVLNAGDGKDAGSEAASQSKPTAAVQTPDATPAKEAEPPEPKATAVSEAAGQSTPLPEASPAGAPLADKAQLDEAIRSYILAHPEVIIEAIQNYQQQQALEQQQRAREALATQRQDLFNDPLTPVGGNPDGDITIVEFFDYRCHFCKRVLPSVQEILETDKNVRVVFKEFPILGPESVYASRAALSAWKIDESKYLDLHNAIMGVHGQLTERRVDRLVEEAGYDIEAVKSGMESEEIETIIQRNYALAETLNIRGTPAFVIGNQLVPGAIDLEQMRQLIADARKAQSEAGQGPAVETN